MDRVQRGCLSMALMRPPATCPQFCSPLPSLLQLVFRRSLFLLAALLLLACLLGIPLPSAAQNSSQPQAVYQVIGGLSPLRANLSLNDELPSGFFARVALGFTSPSQPSSIPDFLLELDSQFPVTTLKQRLCMPSGKVLTVAFGNYVDAVEADVVYTRQPFFTFQGLYYPDCSGFSVANQTLQNFTVDEKSRRCNFATVPGLIDGQLFWGLTSFSAPGYSPPTLTNSSTLDMGCAVRSIGSHAQSPSVDGVFSLNMQGPSLSSPSSSFNQFVACFQAGDEVTHYNGLLLFYTEELTTISSSLDYAASSSFPDRVIVANISSFLGAAVEGVGLLLSTSSQFTLMPPPLFASFSAWVQNNTAILGMVRAATSFRNAGLRDAGLYLGALLGTLCYDASPVVLNNKTFPYDIFPNITINLTSMYYDTEGPLPFTVTPQAYLYYAPADLVALFLTSPGGGKLLNVVPGSNTSFSNAATKAPFTPFPVVCYTAAQGSSYRAEFGEDLFYLGYPWMRNMLISLTYWGTFYWEPKNCTDFSSQYPQSVEELGAAPGPSEAPEPPPAPPPSSSSLPSPAIPGPTFTFNLTIVYPWEVLSTAYGSSLSLGFSLPNVVPQGTYTLRLATDTGLPWIYCGNLNPPQGVLAYQPFNSSSFNVLQCSGAAALNCSQNTTHLVANCMPYPGSLLPLSNPYCAYISLAGTQTFQPVNKSTNSTVPPGAPSSQGNIFGDFAQADQLLLNGELQPNISLPFFFGCSEYQNGSWVDPNFGASGVLDLSNSVFGLPYQAKAQWGSSYTSFSICLPAYSPSEAPAPPAPPPPPPLSSPVWAFPPPSLAGPPLDFLLGSQNFPPPTAAPAPAPTTPPQNPAPTPSIVSKRSMQQTPAALPPIAAPQLSLAPGTPEARGASGAPGAPAAARAPGAARAPAAQGGSSSGTLPQMPAASPVARPSAPAPSTSPKEAPTHAASLLIGSPPLLNASGIMPLMNSYTDTNPPAINVSSVYVGARKGPALNFLLPGVPMAFNLSASLSYFPQYAVETLLRQFLEDSSSFLVSRINSTKFANNPALAGAHCYKLTNRSHLTYYNFPSLHLYNSTGSLALSFPPEAYLELFQAPKSPPPPPAGASNTTTKNKRPPPSPPTIQSNGPCVCVLLASSSSDYFAGTFQIGWTWMRGRLWHFDYESNTVSWLDAPTSCSSAAALSGTFNITALPSPPPPPPPPKAVGKKHTRTAWGVLAAALCMLAFL